MVCQNTLNLALRDARGEGLSIRHRPSLDERVREARQTLGIVVARFDRFDAELHAMLSRQVRPAELERYVDEVLPATAGDASDRQREARERTRGVVLSHFDDPSNTLPGVRGTAWAAYNAVSQWADHERTVRGRNEQARAENRLASVWFGGAHALKQRAYRGALELATHHN